MKTALELDLTELSAVTVTIHAQHTTVLQHSRMDDAMQQMDMDMDMDIDLDLSSLDRADGQSSSFPFADPPLHSASSTGVAGAGYVISKQLMRHTLTLYTKKTSSYRLRCSE
jgi:hypothetical protein